MKVESLFPYLLISVNGVPDVTAKQALVLSAIDFCQRSLAWNEILDPVALEPGIGTYDVDIPTDAMIVNVMAIWLGAQQLKPVTMAKLMQVLPNWQDSTGSQPAYYNAPTDAGAVRLYPIPGPDAAGSIVMRAAYAPSLAAKTLPDGVVTDNLETIIAGALSRLMEMPGRSWSNPQMAVYYKQQFEDGIVKARIDVEHDKVQGTITVLPRPFGF